MNNRTPFSPETTERLVDAMMIGAPLLFVSIALALAVAVWLAERKGGDGR